MEIFYILIFICFATVIFIFLTSKSNKINNKLSLELESLKQREIDYIKTIASLQASIQVKDELLTSKNDEIILIREQMSRDFQLMANRILEEKTSKFTDTNKMNMEAILKPLSEKLVEFKTKVEETYDKESKQRFSLEERIRELVALNNQISTEANNLTQALKGNSKIQGNWGEMLLESILEKSGLRNGSEYHIQKILVDDTGGRITNEQNQSLQPDVVITYPGGHKIIIDSKASLTAYIRYVDADNDAERLNAEKEHVVSIKKHIDELSNKSYQDYVESLDFVMMFIPNEPAYILGMQVDGTLWDYAYKKRVLLISPTNLIASLKVVSDLWKREYQSRNAKEIAKRGALLYDKFAGFVQVLHEVGKNIEKSQTSYDKAMSQLKDGNGNLIRQAEMLKELGVKAQKKLPGLETE